MGGNIRFIALAITLSGISTICGSQSTYHFRHYDISDGLASNYLTSVVQDSLGFIWISTDAGVTRFDGYSFRNYQFDPNDSSKLALSVNTVDLAIDHQGTLWMTPPYSGRSPVGFAKYDFRGDRFVHYEIDVNNARIYGMSFEKDYPVIWFRTMGDGLYRFNYTTKETRHYYNPGVSADISYRQNSISDFEDLGGFLLLATEEGLWLVEKSTGHFSRPVINVKDSGYLLRSHTFALFKSHQYKYSTDIAYWLLINVDDGDLLAGIDRNYAIVKQFRLPKGLGNWSISDRKDVFWLNYGSKIVQLNPADGAVTELVHLPTDPFSLRLARVRNMFADRDNNLWLATDHGLSVTTGDKIAVQTTRIRTGRIRGSGLLELPEGNFLTISVEGSLSSGQEILIAPIGTGPELLSFTQLLMMKGNAVYAFHQGKKYFWIASVGRGASVVGLPLHQILHKPKPAIILQRDSEAAYTIDLFQMAIWEDPAGDLWLPGSEGLRKVLMTIPYGQPGSVRLFQHAPDNPNSIAPRDAFMLVPEESDKLWVLTLGGVDLLDTKNSTFQHIDINNHLPGALCKGSRGGLWLGTSVGVYPVMKVNDRYALEDEPIWSGGVVYNICEDHQGNLWFYTSVGLVHFDIEARSAIRFLQRDGFVDTGNYTGRLHVTSKGLVILTDVDGVSVIDPRSLEQSTRSAYPILTDLKVSNLPAVVEGRTAKPEQFLVSSEIALLEELKLDYLHNNFTLEFSAMEMTAPEKNLYRHKLEGFDKDWIETDYKSRTATYTNLPSGTYTFRVKASNHHGVWSDNERTLKVIILPPPWRTWWAYSSYGLLVTGLLVWARRNIVQRERLKSNLKLEHLELEKAKEVDKVKTSFFTNISHEFRTPLTLIKGPVQSMIEQFVSGQQEIDRKKIIDQLKLIQRNSDLLLKLINQLLDLAKLESGTLKVEKSEGEVFSFVRAVASSFESMARQKGITLVLDVPAESQPAVFDKDKLETILINLVNNAIKFTGSGGTVSVEARCRNSTAETQRRKELELIVRDTGIGIPAEHQSKIFERFHQVSEAHKEVGTGIGLALVKELVTLMNGTISVNSEPGKGLPDVALSKSGSEFVVEIPIEEVTSYQPVHESFSAGRLPVSGGVVDNFEIDQPDTGDRQAATIDNGDSTQPHILVVEDNTDLRKFIIDSLGGEFSFLEAENGVEGLGRATEGIPDMIISDVMMPEMDGITMAGKIREQTLTGHIPIILLTARSTEASKISGLRSGADDYLTKPFNKEELLLKVRNRISRQQKLREKLRAELMGAAPKVSVLSEDERFLQTVKEKILERLGDEQLSVESLAEEIGLSRVQLYRKVSGLTDMSVNELIRKLRLQRAAQLLAQQWGPVSQVAYEVGFSNLSYFSKVFKEEFGVLPSEYTIDQHKV